jgi:hypothetical protein
LLFDEVGKGFSDQSTSDHINPRENLHPIYVPLAYLRAKSYLIASLFSLARDGGK